MLLIIDAPSTKQSKRASCEITCLCFDLSAQDYRHNCMVALPRGRSSRGTLCGDLHNFLAELAEELYAPRLVYISKSVRCLNNTPFLTWKHFESSRDSISRLRFHPYQNRDNILLRACPRPSPSPEGQHSPLSTVGTPTSGLCFQNPVVGALMPALVNPITSGGLCQIFVDEIPPPKSSAWSDECHYSAYQIRHWPIREPVYSLRLGRNTSTRCWLETHQGGHSQPTRPPACSSSQALRR